MKARGLASWGVRSERRLHQAGFSLSELLVVLAIMGVLFSLAIIGLGGTMTAQALDSTLDDLSSLIQSSKSYAMSHNTYVRVGFLNQSSQGHAELIANAVASQDGTATLPGATNSNVLYPISKVLHFANVQFTDQSGLPLSQPLPVISPAPSFVGTAGGGSPVTFVSGGYTFLTTITITPQGEVLSENPSVVDPLSSPYIPILDLGLQAVKGGAVLSQGPCGVLWIYGSNGQTRVFRL